MQVKNILAASGMITFAFYVHMLHIYHNHYLKITSTELIS